MRKSDQLINVVDVLRIILRRWIWGASLGAVVACFLVVGFLIRDPEYEAVASVTVELHAENVMNIREVLDTKLPHASLLSSFMNTQVERLKTRSITEAVIDSLNDEELEALLAPYTDSAESDASELDVIKLIQKEMLQVELGDAMESQVIRVLIRHQDPVVAKTMANAYIDQFIAYKAGLRNVSTSKAVDFLGRQLEQMEEELKQSEQNLQDFREAQHLVSVDSRNNSRSFEQVRRLGDAVIDARIRLLAAENRVQQIKACERDLNCILKTSFIGGRDEILAVYNQLSELKRERQVLNETYLRKHPRIVENQASQNSVTEALSKLVSQACNQVASEHHSIQQEVLNLEQKLEDAEQEVLAQERALVEYRRMEAEVENQRKILGMLSDRYNETSISQNMDLRSVRVLDRAELPTEPLSASFLQIGAAACFLAGIIFVAVPLCMEILDNRLSSFADIESYSGKALLGDIRNYPQKDFEELSQAVLRSDIDLIEPFRAIYARIRLQMPSSLNESTSFVVTSSLPEEGKSTVAGNLAAIFAQHSYRVLVVDFDLRRATLQLVFGVKDNSKGVIPWYEAAISNPSKLEDVMSDKELGIVEIAENLYFLSSGGVSVEPTKVLGSKELAQLFAALKEEFDVIVFDTPPVGLFPDATLVAEFADDCVFVARQYKASRQKVRYSIGLMDQSGAAVLGVVFNGIKDISTAIGYGNQSVNYYGDGVEKDFSKYSAYYRS